MTLLPTTVAELLRAFPYDFLYGSIAADTSIAKKYAAAGRHCHSWTVGLEIHDGAPDEPLHAFALGYLAHLAADTVAHNYFVPQQLADHVEHVRAWPQLLGKPVRDAPRRRAARRARELILLDHSRVRRTSSTGS